VKDCKAAGGYCLIPNMNDKYLGSDWVESDEEQSVPLKTYARPPHAQPGVAAPRGEGPGRSLSLARVTLVLGQLSLQVSNPTSSP